MELPIIIDSAVGYAILSEERRVAVKTVKKLDSCTLTYIVISFRKRFNKPNTDITDVSVDGFLNKSFLRIENLYNLTFSIRCANLAKYALNR